MATNSQLSNDFAGLVRLHRKAAKLSQEELGDIARCHGSIISKIESGKLTASRGAVEIFAQAFKLEGDQYKEFITAFGKSIMDREGIQQEMDNSFLRPDEIIEMAENALQEIRALRKVGMPDMAARFAQDRIKLLKVVCYRSANHAMGEELAAILSTILTEAGKSYMDFVKQKDVWEHMAPIITTQREIAKLRNDPVPSILADINEESACYVSKDYKQADKIIKSLLPNIGKLDVGWQIEVIRASVINAGYQGSKEETRYFVNLVADMRNKDIITDPAGLAFVLEGVARAQADVRDQAALSTIQEAAAIYKKAIGPQVYSPLKKVQLIRSELRVAEKLGSRDYQYLEALGNQGIAICMERGYARYLAEIETSLNKILNRK